MKFGEIWRNIPKGFRVALLASVGLVILASIVAGIIIGVRFGVESAITGGFSVALLCVYVVQYGRILAGVREASKDGPNEAAATTAASRLMVLSLVRLLLFAAALIVCVVVFKFDVRAAIVGVTGVYLPLLVLPRLFPDGEGEASEGVDAERGDG